MVPGSTRMNGRQRTSSSAAKGVLAICAAAATLLFGGATWGQEPPAPLKTAKAGAIGTILVGPSGMTLYTFASDQGDGKSACTGACARQWPTRPAAPARPPPSAERISPGRRDQAVRLEGQAALLLLGGCQARRHHGSRGGPELVRCAARLRRARLRWEGPRSARPGASRSPENSRAR